MRTMPLLLLATCSAPLPRVAAQEPGPRVRVTLVSSSSRRLVGTLIGQDADSLWVRLPGQAAPMSVARTAVVLEVSRGRHRAVGEGARVGAALGLIGGVVVSTVAASKSQFCKSPDLFHLCSLDTYGRALEGGIVGGAIAAVLGGALGYLVRTDRWEGVPLRPGHHLALAPHGAGLELSLSF